VSGARRGVVATAGVLLLAGGLATGITQVAGAAPQPSVSQVQSKINSLTGEFNKAVEQYDNVAQQLTQAKSRLKQVDTEVTADKTKYNRSKVKVVQIANASFEDSNATSLAGLITSGNPGEVLNEASMILQLTGTRNLEAEQFLSSAQQLASVQQEQQRTEYGISQLASQRSKTKNSIQANLDTQKSELQSLDNAQEEAAVQADSLGGGTSSAATTVTSVPSTTTGQAATAVGYVLQMAADHCPYVFGATGPCSNGFDCSGLVQSAWASAGVSIPRDTYEQWAALPHIPTSDIVPGDLLYYDGEGHVAMYVGNGMIVDAPQTGLDVEEIPMDTDWYAQNFDGAVQP
jgi:cell wall-associated NlpC family hydrolase